MATIAEVKEFLLLSLGNLWEQWRENEERLHEARLIVRSLSRGHRLSRDGGMKGVVVGKGKKKNEIVESMLQDAELSLEEAMVHRDNCLFQQVGLRDKLLSIIQGVDELREVWREEVHELMAWTPEKGELVEERGEAEVMRGVQEEEVRGEVEEQPPKRRKVRNDRPMTIP